MTEKSRPFPMLRWPSFYFPIENHPPHRHFQYQEPSPAEDDPRSVRWHRGEIDGGGEGYLGGLYSMSSRTPRRPVFSILRGRPPNTLSSMSDRAFHVWLRASSENPVGPSIHGGLEHLPPPALPSIPEKRVSRRVSESRSPSRAPVPVGVCRLLAAGERFRIRFPGGKSAPEAAARQRVWGRDPPSEGPMRQTGSPSRVGARPCRGPSSENLSGGN
ncbi:hypothetical protein BDBG_17005 [Blastomyces gilchristii SLH14081]|uniref:Uncharacterized protein n=1 Tax=Blastomyces gilchristii (strain SLH14081) TaxID=559298 RepID=A0A179UMA5_BLAGS|nr:uncharacterized protein BDBG_17005 [Blastomyces gilchristii SLH14081]OAT08358.1 hypothetical protein BDBG_17005 [Blastomyces gilchristii SLH14081]